MAYPPHILITITEFLESHRKPSLNLLIARPTIADKIVVAVWSIVWSAAGLIVGSVADAGDVTTFLTYINFTLQTWQRIASIALQIPHPDFDFFIIGSVSGRVTALVPRDRVRTFEFLAQDETFSTA
jgi:hypothetical protein